MVTVWIWDPELLDGLCAFHLYEELARRRFFLTTLILRNVWNCYVVSAKLRRAQKTGDLRMISIEMIVK